MSTPRQLTCFFFIFLNLIIQRNKVTSPAVYQPSPLQTAQYDLASLLSQQRPDRDKTGLSTTEVKVYKPLQKPNPQARHFDKQLHVPRQLRDTEIAHWGHVTFYYSTFRIWTIGWHNVGGPIPQPIRYLEEMYIQTRNRILYEWEKLPEQPLICLAFGYLVLSILPPAGRTVPWDVVEELVNMLRVMATTYLAGEYAGSYRNVAETIVVMFNLVIVAPG